MEIVEYAIKNHSSIVTSKNNKNPNDQFSFKPVAMISKEISNFKPGKAVCCNDISTKILKDLEDLFATFICNKYNKSLLDGISPEDLKTAKVVPVYKKKNALTKIITDS